MSAAALHAIVSLAWALLQVPQALPPAAEATPDSPATPLTASAGVAPDSVTVGEHFRVHLRIDAPPDAIVEFPPFRLVEPVEAVDSLRVSRDSTGGWNATYALTAWTTSDSLVGHFPFRVRAAAGGYQDLRVRVTLPRVRSVLPADSSLHLPRPAKAVIPIAMPGPAPRGWLIPAVLLALLLAGIVWLALRRRDAPATEEADPRRLALKRLDEIDAERLPQRGLMREYHDRTSRVLREYLSARGPWGEDLTTTELLIALDRAGMAETSHRRVARLLREADRVKFSGLPAEDDVTSAERHGAELRAWIEAWPSAEAPAYRAEAA